MKLPRWFEVGSPALVGAAPLHAPKDKANPGMLFTICYGGTWYHQWYGSQDR